MRMEAILSSLCYFSLFFAPFLFPLIVYFIVKDREVMDHARNSFLSHIIPLLAIPILFFIVLNNGFELVPVLVAFGLYGLVSLIVLVWNIVKGIKVLLEDQ
jgi:uncharacterized Tic20 family protein